MFRITVNGGRLTDDGEPFSFSHDPNLLNVRPKLFDYPFLKDLPIYQDIANELSKEGTKSDENDIASATASDDVSLDASHDPFTISGLHYPFGDSWFKELPIYRLMKQEFSKNDIKRSEEEKKSATVTQSKDAATDNRFRVTFETGDFGPEEIDVSLDGDRLKIHGKKTGPDGSREMTKWYKLPENINTDELTSSLSRDGLLQVTAPLQESHEAEKNDFQVEVPLEEFKPEHINVSIEGRRLQVHAKKCEERSGHSAHEEITRWFTLPEKANTQPDGLTTTINDDGSMVIQVPLNCAVESLNISGDNSGTVAGSSENVPTEGAATAPDQK
ncbi:uncharacterized protein LOC117123062 [Anneissia japonica]|uniref:uncharacterized protein LOC117123062 n=1 Tax=Anneissia japonica TaxID=1529436 RepID=UPI00142580D8|nr:uncharacterized protein LOC117123062 [Anneissia japonica]